MEFIEDQYYYVGARDVVVRKEAKTKSDPLNHLVFGDWLQYLGERSGDWVQIFSRNTTGWIPADSVTDKRALEINFIDIGQGDGCHIVTPDDEIIVLDAGIGDNMHRFLSWRYNLRYRQVAGVDGVEDNTPGAKGPKEFDYAVISHPDQDHYYGFLPIFEDPKIKVNKVFHNGIVERPIKKEDKDPDLRYYSSDDLGGYMKDEESGKYYIWDIVDSTSQMNSLISKHKNTRKKYLSTLEAAKDGNKDVKFISVNADDLYFDHFDDNNELTFKVLGPVSKRIKKGNASRKCLMRLGSEGITKNGHSIVFQVQIGKLRILLGGDLNTEAEDHLLKHYCETEEEVSSLENRIHELHERFNDLDTEELQELAEKESLLQSIIVKGRRFFQSDVAKACHHGSHHFSESFIKIINSIVTVISSGDNENYSHPRPEALGAFGKYGRGRRPLIFSTELARSTNEFVNVYKYFEELQKFQERLRNAPNDALRSAIQTEMEGRRDRMVAVYGMISLRTDGERVVISQKLEKNKSEGEKWDLYELYFNEDAGEFQYLMH